MKRKKLKETCHRVKQTSILKDMSYYYCDQYGARLNRKVERCPICKARVLYHV